MCFVAVLRLCPPQQQKSSGGEYMDQTTQIEGAFLSDVKEIRRRARQHINEGAVTPGYKADRDQVVSVLNEALATEIVCILRYKRHYFMATGIHAQSVAEEFLQHAN